jgi:hypothetical protein
MERRKQSWTRKRVSVANPPALGAGTTFEEKRTHG